MASVTEQTRYEHPHFAFEAASAAPVLARRICINARVVLIKRQDTDTTLEAVLSGLFGTGNSMLQRVALVTCDASLDDLLFSGAFLAFSISYLRSDACAELSRIFQF